MFKVHAGFLTRSIYITIGDMSDTETTANKTIFENHHKYTRENKKLT